MSMMKTLAKVAIGVAVAKGVSGMMKKGGGGQTASRGQVGNGGLFGGMHSPNAQAQSGGGIEDMLGSILGGGGTGSTQSGGGLGGLLEQLGGTSRGGSSGGGLNDLLGGLAGAGKGGGGGLGDMLGGLLGAAAGKAPSQSGGGFGDLLNQAIARQDEPEQAPSADQEAMAALMLRAMIAAMKSDGEIDAAEQEKLMGRLGDVSPEEQAFVQNELRQPLSADAIARDVPRGLEAQVYAMSVMGIDLDSQSEAKYLHQLASAMGIGPKDVNHIHEQMGVPAIYA
ncbi:DUF533 domain-containing protein [Roseovarius sp. 2305UL8-3]|uniref:DUF533 domain-containing protein n=1 Tax=Roseovarius conchicola TaxID=3121636 RepID=UPI003528F996